MCSNSRATKVVIDRVRDTATVTFDDGYGGRPGSREFSAKLDVSKPGTPTLIDSDSMGGYRQRRLLEHNKSLGILNLDTNFGPAYIELKKFPELRRIVEARTNAFAFA